MGTIVGECDGEEVGDDFVPADGAVVRLSASISPGGGSEGAARRCSTIRLELRRPVRDHLDLAVQLGKVE